MTGASMPDNDLTTRASTRRCWFSGATSCAPASDRPERIFEAVREVVKQSGGVIAKRNRRALDSTRCSTTPCSARTP